jgi:hypothetical protein
MEQLMYEIWKDIKNYEGCYQVSSRGNIRRLDTQIPFEGTLSIRQGREIKTTRNSKGYLTVVLCWKSLRKTYNVHRLVLETFVPRPDQNTLQVNHKDGNKENNSLENLEWCTASENQLHAYKYNLKGKGSKAGMAKLDENKVLEIKKRLKNNQENIAKNKLYKLIAKDYGVTGTSIKWIDKERTWRHVQLTD